MFHLFGTPSTDEDVPSLLTDLLFFLYLSMASDEITLPILPSVIVVKRSGQSPVDR
jgi:hypothetical protein